MKKVETQWSSASESLSNRWFREFFRPVACVDAITTTKFSNKIFFLPKRFAVIHKICNFYASFNPLWMFHICYTLLPSLRPNPQHLIENWLSHIIYLTYLWAFYWISLQKASRRHRYAFIVSWKWFCWNFIHWTNLIWTFAFQFKCQNEDKLFFPHNRAHQKWLKNLVYWRALVGVGGIHWFFCNKPHFMRKVCFSINH